MKKFIISFLSAVIVLLGGGYYVADKFGGLAGLENNFPGVNSIATTTHSYLSFCEDCPVKLLDYDPGRRYARIENTGETGVGVWIYLAEADQRLNISTHSTTTKADEAYGIYYTTDSTGIYNGLATSTDVLSTDLYGGMIYLGVPTSSAPSFYEITPSNLHFGEVWATSTATGTIAIIYR